MLNLIPSQYKLIAAGVAVLALMALSAAGAWQWQGNAYGKRLADQAAAHETFLRQVAEANAEVILKQQAARLALEQRLATADKQSTDALTGNDRLERLYSSADDERRRLRIEVKVARADAVVSAAAGSGSVGDAASVELSAEAGRTVWDIRRGIKQDQAALEYLQEWARQILGVR